MAAAATMPKRNQKMLARPNMTKKQVTAPIAEKGSPGKGQDYLPNAVIKYELMFGHSESPYYKLLSEVFSHKALLCHGIPRRLAAVCLGQI